MSTRILTTLAALCLCAAPLVALDPLLAHGLTPAASFDVWSSTVGGEQQVHFQLNGAGGDAFAVFATLEDSDSLGASILVGVAPLDDKGSGESQITLPAQPCLTVYFLVAYRIGGRVTIVKAPHPFGQEPVCDSLDFDYTLGSDAVMVAGRRIDEQWADIGLHVSAVNKVVGKPDAAILFDSDLPSVHDPDLVVGEGMLLILPEDDIDVAPADGLVDTPNDAMKGGRLIFDFDMPYAMNRIRLVDFDEPGSQLRFYRDHDVTTPQFVIAIPVVGDGDVQTLTFNQLDITRLELVLAGSGAVVGLCGLPCPRVINFDETPFGRPLDLPAGTIVGNQFFDSGLGVGISALNGHWSAQLPAQNHPDAAILFDSDLPTGGDTDLGVHQGNILIIGEDDYDVAPFDGLVDDPDDEAEGGVLTFTFDRAVRGFEATIVDVDEVYGPSELRCYDAFDVMIGLPIPLLPGPDGNVQVVSAQADSMRRLELVSSGSAAVAELRYCLYDER